MNDRILPPFAEEFINAKNRHDGEAFTSFFTPDAVVYDEGEKYTGHNAIRKWIDNANAQYNVSYSFLNYGEDGGKALLTLMVSGNFDGSPLPLDYRITLKDGKIAELEITLSE